MEEEGGHLARRELGARSRVIALLAAAGVARVLPGAPAASECERLLLPAPAGELRFFARDGRDGSGVCARVPAADARRVSAAAKHSFTSNRYGLHVTVGTRDLPIIGKLCNVEHCIDYART